MKRQAAILFYIDALDLKLMGHSYMPFLSTLVESEGYYTRPLGNVLGYSFAIQSCMFSGKFPDESGQWLPYCFSQGNPSLLFQTLAKYGRPFLLDHLPKLRYLMMQFLRKFVMRKGVQVNNIPLSVISDFTLFPYYYPCELPSFFELRDLVQRRYNVQLTYIGPPSSKGDSMYEVLAKRVRRPDNPSIIIAYEDRLDEAAHKVGPASPNYGSMAKHIDRKMESVYRIAKSEYGDPILVFFSDHSQSNLEGYIDITSSLAMAGFEVGKDYLCFIDATMALIWTEVESTRRRIADSLQRLNVGAIITERLRRRYHLTFENKRMYGDMIYVLKPGWTFFPNFFSPQKPMNGLHGYMPDEDVQRAFVIIDKRVSAGCHHVKNIRDVILKCAKLIH